jgi:hypothetical protein
VLLNVRAVSSHANMASKLLSDESTRDVYIALVYRKRSINSTEVKMDGALTRCFFERLALNCPSICRHLEWPLRAAGYPPLVAAQVIAAGLTRRLNPWKRGRKRGRIYFSHRTH